MLNNSATSTLCACENTVINSKESEVKFVLEGYSKVAQEGGIYVVATFFPVHADC